MSIKQLDDASKIYKQLLDSMAKIDNKYSTTYQEQRVDAPDSLGMQKLTYEMPSEEDISRLAEQYYSANKQKEVSQINDSTSKTLQSLAQKAKSILEKATQGQIEIATERDADLKNTNYSAQKNNLTNSSIKSGMMDKINTLAEQALNTLQQNTDNSLNDIETQKSNLTDSAKQQLEALEEIYAKKIADKTEEIRQEALEKADEVTKYNNSVEEKEAKYKKSLADQLAELEKQEWQRLQEILELTERIGESGVEEQKAIEKYNAVKKVLDQYPPETALQILEGSTAFKSHLVDRYDSLRAYFSNKQQQ